MAEIAGLKGVIDALQALPKEVVSKNGGPVRAALRKGAKVIHKEALKNLDNNVGASLVEGEAGSTGFLKANTVVTRGKPLASGKGERYLVRTRRKNYPDRGQKTTTLKVAQILEYGSEKQTAEPYLRPAFHSKKAEALRVVVEDLKNSIDRIVKKLSKGK